MVWKQKKNYINLISYDSKIVAPFGRDQKRIIKMLQRFQTDEW